MTAAIVISLIALSLTVLGLVVKVTSFTTKIDVYVKEMRRERKSVLRIPIIEMRVGYIEQHLRIHPPHLPSEPESSDEDHES